MFTDASRKCHRRTRILVQHARTSERSKTPYIHLRSHFLSTSAAIPRPTMTVLTDHETLELQRKIERLANALVTPEQCDEWKQHFRTDTDLQGIKSLLAQKRARLPFAPLPEWQQNEVTLALAQVETCIQRMEVNHNRQVAFKSLKRTLSDDDQFFLRLLRRQGVCRHSPGIHPRRGQKRRNLYWRFRICSTSCRCDDRQTRHSRCRLPEGQP